MTAAGYTIDLGTIDTSNTNTFSYHFMNIFKENITISPNTITATNLIPQAKSSGYSKMTFTIPSSITESGEFTITPTTGQIKNSFDDSLHDNIKITYTIEETDTGGASDSYDYLVNYDSADTKYTLNSNDIYDLELMPGTYTFDVSDAGTFSIKDSTGLGYGNKSSNILTLNIYSNTPQLIMKGEIEGSEQTLKVIDMLPPWAGPPGNPQP
tara:strand:- start:321 stop:953 length:633 start_codon:yes stop_codon:yes gene_type:complete